MILYHGTTETRALQIFQDRCIKKDVERYFTEESNGDGYTTQGFVYLTNEITFAVHFANCHNLSDRAKALYLFRIDVPDEMVEADYDELRYQMAREDEIERCGGTLSCSLLEYKACRVAAILSFEQFPMSYYKIDLTNGLDADSLTDFAGYNLKGTIENYTLAQKDFIQNVVWTAV